MFIHLASWLNYVFNSFYKIYSNWLASAPCILMTLIYTHIPLNVSWKSEPLCVHQRTFHRLWVCSLQSLLLLSIRQNTAYLVGGEEHVFSILSYVPSTRRDFNQTSWLLGFAVLPKEVKDLSVWLAGNSHFSMFPSVEATQTWAPSIIFSLS